MSFEKGYGLILKFGLNIFGQFIFETSKGQRVMLKS